MPPHDNKIYLTFDDGPHPVITPWVLDLLKQYNWKATFFCVGNNVQKYPETYQQIINEGHAVGNHTFNHLKGTATPSENYIQNIAECANLVKSNLFRPPYGRITREQSAVIKDQYQIIMWSLLSGDFDKNLDPEKALQKLNKLSKAGLIVVFHDSEKAEKNLRIILPRYLDYLCQNNFKPGCF